MRLLSRPLPIFLRFQPATGLHLLALWTLAHRRPLRSKVTSGERLPWRSTLCKAMPSSPAPPASFFITSAHLTVHCLRGIGTPLCEGKAQLSSPCWQVSQRQSGAQPPWDTSTCAGQGVTLPGPGSSSSLSGEDQQWVASFLDVKTLPRAKR